MDQTRLYLSGKTYTMLGDEQNRGVIPLAVDQIFSDITSSANQKQFLIRVSYVEIYNETISDLLVNVSLKFIGPRSG